MINVSKYFGINKTLDLLTRSFWWPHLRKFVKDDVRTSYACCRAKMPRHHSYGLLQPLPIPSKPWQIFTTMSNEFPQSVDASMLCIAVQWSISFIKK